MKSIYIFSLLFFFSLFAFSNPAERVIVVSPIISIGAGTISSANILKNNLNTLAQIKNSIPRLETTYNWGLNYGIGLSFQYQYSSWFGVVTGFEVKKANPTITINIKESALNGGAKFLYNYRHTNNFSINYIHLPLLIKLTPITIKQKAGIYILAGVAADVITSDKLFLTEETTLAEYKNDKLINTSDVSTYSQAFNIDQFKSPRTSLIAGIGTYFPIIKNKNLNISLTYSLPFIKSAMYSTTNTNPKFNGLNIFSYYDKMYYEGHVGIYNLHDFKMSSVYLSLSFDFLKEVKSKK